MQKVQHLSPMYSLVGGRNIFLANRNDVYIGQAIINYGEFSHLEMELFEKLIKPTDIVLDIGANIGAHTVDLAKICEHVYAWEPQPQIFYNLCANVALNSLQNVTCFNEGLSNRYDQLYIEKYDYSKMNNFGGISLADSGEVAITVHELDTFELSPAFMKIDVEGAELDVLKGARQTINNNRPIMYIENDRAEKSKALIQHLVDLEYSCFWHMPYLFNDKNFFKNKKNIYQNIVSINMVCVPSEREVPPWVEVLRPVSGPDDKPFN